MLLTRRQVERLHGRRLTDSTTEHAAPPLDVSTQCDMRAARPRADPVTQALALRIPATRDEPTEPIAIAYTRPKARVLRGLET